MTDVEFNFLLGAAREAAPADRTEYRVGARLAVGAGWLGDSPHALSQQGHDD